VTARFNNLRNGCFECRKEAGSPRRLTFEQVTARAKALGFRLGFEPAAYGGNQMPLPWICVKDEAHVVIDTLGHLERGCPQCRAEEGSPSRLSFDAVRERAEALGFRPGFKAEEYGGNRMMLPWICVKDASHTVVTTLASLVRGCAACHQWARATATARRHGFQPGFKGSEYQGNRVPMRWVCVHDESHVTVRPLHRLSRGCPHCRKAARRRPAKLRT